MFYISQEEKRNQYQNMFNCIKSWPCKRIVEFHGALSYPLFFKALKMAAFRVLFGLGLAALISLQFSRENVKNYESFYPSL
jgi:hypothetical protein